MTEILKKQRGSSILGLSFDGNRLEGIVLRRTNGSARVAETFSATLALDVLNADAPLLGREIRNHLDKAEIRERRCAVCVPLNWALTLQTKLPPQLSEADAASFLQIEAEKNFPANYETLSIATSRSRVGDEQFVTLIAIPRNHLARLESALRAARLHPISFSLGVTALQMPRSENAGGVIALAVGSNSLDLEIDCGGGVAALRTLDGAFETEGAQKKIDAEFLAREIRITLGQLPGALRETVRELKIIGRSELAQLLAREITPRATFMAIVVEPVQKILSGRLEGEIPAPFSVSPALALATRVLMEGQAVLEFLPPRSNAWQQMTARLSSKKLGWVGATAGSMALVILLAFLVQQIRLSLLESKWAKMEAKVNELDDAQQKIRKFRPWFDESFRELTILKKLAEVFPEEGAVSAKAIEIREPGAGGEATLVTCSGTAKTTQALFQMTDKLSATSGVSDVHTETRGSAPLQFSFNFRWEGGHGN